MNEQKFDINRLRIASPCSVGWENMTGDERERFCGLCSRTVYNISEMTETEVRTLIAGANGKLCGRIYRRADGTVMTKDCPVGLRALRKRTARFAGAVLTALLGMVSVSFAQSGSKKKDKVVQASTLKMERTPVPAGKGILTGLLLDINGAVIPEANVSLFLVTGGKKDGNKITVRSDSDGVYLFTGLATGTYDLEIKAIPGFKRLLVEQIKIEEGEQVKLDLTLENKTPEVEVVVGGIMSDGLEINTTEVGGKTIITREMLDRMPKRNLF